MKKSTKYPWHIVLPTIRHMTTVSHAFRHLWGHSVQTDYRITFKIPHVTLITEQYIYVYICVYKICKSYNIKIVVQYHSLFSPNCLKKSLCITHEVPPLTVFKLFSNIQFATAIFETRSTQHTPNTTLACYQTTKCWKLFCVSGGGEGRRTRGDLPTAVMRMPIGPLGQWESPTVEHGQHHSDIVGTQLKMVQRKFMFKLWFVSKET